MRQVEDEDPEILNYLAEHGIKTGVDLVIREVSPIGVIDVETTDESVSISREVASEVRVEQTG